MIWYLNCIIDFYIKISILSYGCKILMKKLNTYAVIAITAICFNTSAQAEILKMGVNHNAPPYIYLDGNGHLTGFTIELAEAIGKEAGFNVKAVPLPFASVLAAMENKEIDIIGQMYGSTERAKIYDFVNSYNDEFKFIRLKNKVHAKPAAALSENTKVAVIEGSPQFKELLTMQKQDYPSIVIRDADTNFLAFKELFQEKSEVMFAPISEINSLRNNYQQYEFEILDIPPQYSHIQAISINYATRKGEDDLHQRILKGFEATKASGAYTALLKKYNL